MTAAPARDRAHIDPAGLVLTDSDLMLLAQALGRVVTWPSLRATPPSQAMHMAAIRTEVFGGQPGGDILAAMRDYDGKRRAAGQPEAFGAHFLMTCQLAKTRAGHAQQRRDRPAKQAPDVGADVLRMWLGG